jgi:leucyl/phenylalanyl-tRNA--protein transferase
MVRHRRVPLPRLPVRRRSLAAAADGGRSAAGGGAAYLFSNEYESSLIEHKTGWTSDEVLARVGVRVTTLGKNGARIEVAGQPAIEVPTPPEEVKADPTGVGDAFRAGFLSGLTWGLSHERCAQIGSLRDRHRDRGHAGVRLAQPSRFPGYGAAAPTSPHLRCQARACRPPHLPRRLGLPDRGTPAGDEVLGSGDSPRARCCGLRAGCSPCGSAAGRWWSPDPRGAAARRAAVRSLRRSCRRFEITIATAFTRSRRLRRPARPAWIDLLPLQPTPRTRRRAHRSRAHPGPLVGGLYGVEIGGLFAGESMFGRATDASKVALVGLVERLRAAPEPRTRLLDVQWRTDHLATLGVDVPRPQYLLRLRRAIALPPAFSGG